ncbi:hypothetical protein JII91_29765 (plasmid) [Klebsiella quasipneumoniae]|uniref:hypothetical protein n=1 Tax=Klebsiella quasipneumoniae TaxID=1463165 RepID=UPI0019166813|nr:hypothetical protein [Klebsiella quasipneumoniae]QQM83441.1 hypothetical protein JII91_29765 [Klebsiella quasipneumoniae]
MHRGAGLAVALLAAGWLWLRRDFFLRSWVGRWHALMLGIAFLSFFRVDVSGSSQLLSAQQLQIVRSPTRRIDCSVQGGMVTVQ